MDKYDLLLQDAVREQMPPEKTQFQVFLDGRESPILVWGRFFSQEGPMTVFFDHDEQDLYPQTKMIEIYDDDDEMGHLALMSTPTDEETLSEIRRVAAFQTSKIVYVSQVGSTK